MSSQIRSTHVNSQNRGILKNTSSMKSKASFANITDSFQRNKDLPDKNPILDLSKASQFMAKGKGSWSMKELWDLESDSSIFSDPVLGPENSMNIGTSDGRLVSIEQSTGKIRWESKIEGNIRWTTYDKDGTLYAGGSAGVVHAFDKKGEKLWEKKVGKSLVRAPSTNNKGVMFVPDDETGSITALNPKTGEVYWTKDFLSDEANRSPIPLSDGTSLLFRNYTLIKFDDATGRELDTYNVRNYHGKPLVNDKNILFMGKDLMLKQPKVFALDPKNQETLWETPIDAQLWNSELGKDGTLYITTLSGAISAIDPETGKKKWTYKTGHKDAFITLDNKGTLLTGPEEYEEITAVDSKTGGFKGKFKIPEVTYSQPVIGDNGEVFVKQTFSDKVNAYRQMSFNEVYEENHEELEAAVNNKPEIKDEEKFVVIGGVKVKKNG